MLFKKINNSPCIPFISDAELVGFKKSKMTAKILKGPKKFVEVNKGIGELFFERADNFGSLTFQINADTGEKESFSKVRQRSVKVALGLQQLGIKSKDPIVLCCYNDLNNVVPWFASVFINALICSLDTKLSTEDINSALNMIKPKVVFVVEEMLEPIKAGVKLAKCDPTIIVIGNASGYKKMSDMENTEYEKEEDFRPAKIDIHETSFVVLSSGTTSTSKGICLSQYKCMEFASSLPPPKLNGQEYNPHLQPSSLFWISGIWSTVATIAMGNPKLVCPKLTPLKTLNYLSKYKVSASMVGCSVYDILQILETNPNHEWDFSHLKNLTPTGCKLDKDVIYKLRKLFPRTVIFSAYGSTEFGVVTSFSRASPNDPKALEKADSVGLVCPNYEVKIVDFESRESLGPNQEGEMMIKSPFIMNGYYGAQEPLVMDEDGFISTGDSAYYDEDDYVYITGRVVDSFKVLLNNFTYKISPSVIEEQFMKHPDIKMVSVFGIPNPNYIHTPAALVVLKNNAKGDLNEIIKFVNSGLHESLHVRGGIKQVKELPVTVTNKIQKRRCKEIFLSSVI